MKKKTQRRKCDLIWSQIIRSLGRCEWCNKTLNLQAAHFISRSNHQIRFDLRNGISLCAGCHSKAHSDPQGFVEWFKYYRSKDYDYLRAKKNELNKPDYEIIFDKLRKELDNM